MDTETKIFNVDDERVSNFIFSISKEEDKEILELKETAIKMQVPIIRDETKAFIKYTMHLLKPKKILELGTAIAYSTLVIYKETKDYIEKLVTVENYPIRIKEAKKNISKYFDKNKIKLVEQDIDDFLRNNENDEKYDFIFLDAAKGQYIVWLPYIKQLMKKNSVLIADNIFKDGEILESRFLIDKRDRTIHKRMREFLYTIMHDEDFNTQIFNLGDGLSVSIKK